jgi:hypothetical protein
MAADCQPLPGVVTNQVPIDEEPFDNVHERILLEIAGRVMSGIHDYVPKLSALDVQRAQNPVADVPGKPLAGRALDDFSEEPVPDV